MEARFQRWLAMQESAGRAFTDEQRGWLALIHDHVASGLRIEAGDFDYAPFAQQGAPSPSPSDKEILAGSSKTCATP
jgi:type I restriction enzyme R subunit